MNDSTVRELHYLLCFQASQETCLSKGTGSAFYFGAVADQFACIVEKLEKRILRYAMLYYTILYYELLCYDMLCSALHCTALHWTLLYCTVLYYTILMHMQ